MDLMLTSSPQALLVILASKGLGPYLRQHFLDKTFVGLYQINAFDLALLIPYFIVLVILAAYGAHRYGVLRLILPSRFSAIQWVICPNLGEILDIAIV